MALARDKKLLLQEVIASSLLELLSHPEVFALLKFEPLSL
jgi:hypothetical protein